MILNKVDQHIKVMMFQYPSLFPNRLRCLQHMFLVTGNGYRWNDDGCLVSDNDDSIDKMKYSDIDESIEKLDEALSRWVAIDSSLDGIKQFQILCKEKERLDRQFREQHIDLYCKFHDVWEDFQYTDLQFFNSEWSALANAPFGKIDADWLKAMKETVKKIKIAFNRIWHLNYDRDNAVEPSMFSRMPEHFQKMYTEILAIEVKLSGDTNG